MQKSLIILEKPSVAMDFAKALKISGKKDGYIENDKYVVTWCVGHLVEMLYPEAYDIKYKKWTLEDLPFLPKTYKYGIISRVKKQYEIVAHMLHRNDIDTVYWAGDSGKEGQTIEENIRNYGGVRKGMKELRVWIDSQTEEEILKGIKNAKPMSDYKKLGDSGIMRAIEDYSIGINFSRAMSVKYSSLLNKYAQTSKYKPIAVGRVMTCVLGMVVNREREIRNFNESSFYRVVGTFFNEKIEGEWKVTNSSNYFKSPLLYKDNGFKEQKDAEDFISKIKGQQAVIYSLENKKTYKKAPLLFNLAEIQAECSKLYKISPNETLNILQSLYEKKLITYPRTDARVLSSAVAKTIISNLSGLKVYTPTKKYVDNIINNNLYNKLASTQYVDDNKITDHYAIVPTGVTSGVSSLNKTESNLYDLIVRRFLSIFYPSAEYMNAKIEIDIKNERFFMSGKKIIKEGYLEVLENSSSENKNINVIKVMNTLKKGDIIPVSSLNIKEGKTVPPKRYTSGTIILAMENAGQLIEDADLRAQIKKNGIGTSATRANIIEKLIKIEYLKLDKKTQILSPENFGEMVYDVVNLTIPSLLNPKMTASWEKGLDGIIDGSITTQTFKQKLDSFIIKETENITKNNISNELIKLYEHNKNNYTSTNSNNSTNNLNGSANSKTMKNTSFSNLTCPICGCEIRKMNWGWGCSGYNSGCKFSISNKIAGKSITDKNAKDLISKGITEKITGFNSKKGNKFDAKIILDENHKTVFSFV